MSEPATPVTLAIFGQAILTGMMAMHPSVAMASVFGSFLFVALAPQMEPFKSFCLWLFSLGAGYFVGIAVAATSYAVMAPLAAMGLSGFGAMMGAAVWHWWFNKGPKPVWVEFIMSRIPFLREKGDNGP